MTSKHIWQIDSSMRSLFNVNFYFHASCIKGAVSRSQRHGSEPCQTSKMERFAKIVKEFQVHFWKYLTFVKRIYFFITISGVANSTKSEIGFSNEFGCPHEYLWCHDTPRIYLSQIIIGMIFLSIGYPFVMVVSTTLYSKILGPNPQVN